MLVLHALQCVANLTATGKAGRQPPGAAGCLHEHRAPAGGVTAPQGISLSTGLLLAGGVGEGEEGARQPHAGLTAPLWLACLHTGVYEGMRGHTDGGAGACSTEADSLRATAGD